MTIQRLKKQLFTVKDSWPWVAATLFIFALAGLAVRGALKYGADSLGLTIFCVVVATIFILFLARYLIRAKYVDEWNDAFQCNVGCAIISREVPNVKYWLIDEEVSKSAKYWLDIARGPTFLAVCKKEAPSWVNNANAIVKIENSLAYKTIFIEKEVLKVYHPYFMGKAVGIVDEGGNPHVYGETPEAMVNVTRHEVSHVFLEVLGIPFIYDSGANHHRIFRELGYC